MNYLRWIKRGALKTATALLAGSMIGCAGMSGQQAGLGGGAAGALLGAAGTALLVKGGGGNNQQAAGAAIFGGAAGYGVGQKIGQQSGMPGVYTTTVPNQTDVAR